MRGGTLKMMMAAAHWKMWLTVTSKPCSSEVKYKMREATAVSRVSPCKMRLRMRACRPRRRMSARTSSSVAGAGLFLFIPFPFLPPARGGEAFCTIVPVFCPPVNYLPQMGAVFLPLRGRIFGQKRPQGRCGRLKRKGSLCAGLAGRCKAERARYATGSPDAAGFFRVIGVGALQDGAHGGRSCPAAGGRARSGGPPRGGRGYASLRTPSLAARMVAAAPARTSGGGGGMRAVTSLSMA